MAEKSDLPQGILNVLILKMVGLGTVHGYAIARRLREVSHGVVQAGPGSLYPALHRLRNRGYLAGGRGATESRRVAKAYRLAAKGRARLERETASWRRLSRAIGAILGIERAA